MIYYIIIIHFIVVIKLYINEEIYGLKSIYAISLILFLFVPTLYNYLGLVYVDYKPSWLYHLTFLLNTLLLFKLNLSYNGLKNIFNLNFKKSFIQRIFLFSILILLLMSLLAIAGLGHLVRFPSIGFFSITGYFTAYLYLNRKNYNGKWFHFLFISTITFLLFAFVFWSGYGRLIMFQFVSIAMVFLTLVISQKKTIKFLFLLLVPIMIVIGGILRSDSASFSSTLSSGEGAGSLFSTYRDSEYVIRDISSNRFQVVNGESHVAAILFWVPRIFWESKPEGFGKQLVIWYYPSYVDTGFSLAASFIAEAYANFKYFGIPIAILMCYLIFWFISKNLNNYTNSINYKHLRNKLIAICFLCVIPDFIWGGLQTYLIRSVGSALFVFLTFSMLNILGAFRGDNA